MTAYYNEIDPFAAQWLRNLIAAGHIAPGEVDERDIRDVAPADLRSYTQCHFFAGIGVWSPRCEQPDGQMTGPSGPHHAHANRSARQVAEMGLLTSGTYGHLPTTSLKSRNLSYCLVSRLQALMACTGSTLFKLTWKERATPSGRKISALRASVHRTSGNACTSWPTPLVNDTKGPQYGPNRQGGGQSSNNSDARRLANTDGGHTSAEREQRSGQYRQQPQDSATSGFWSDAEWIFCTDNKWRAVEPGTFPLAHGAASRVGRLRAYGNAIVAEVAATYIKAYLTHAEALV